jgi:plasmid stability protein
MFYAAVSQINTSRMTASQIRVRLPENTISKLKAQAQRHGLSLGSLCARILENSAEKIADENYWLSNQALLAQLDIANSQLRSTLPIQEETHVEHQDYLQAILDRTNT